VGKCRQLSTGSDDRRSQITRHSSCHFGLGNLPLNPRIETSGSFGYCRSSSHHRNAILVLPPFSMRNHLSDVVVVVVVVVEADLC